MRLRDGWNVPLLFGRALGCPVPVPQNPLTDDSKGSMTSPGWGRAPPRSQGVSIGVMPKRLLRRFPSMIFD